MGSVLVYLSFPLLLRFSQAAAQNIEHKLALIPREIPPNAVLSFALKQNQMDLVTPPSPVLNNLRNMID